MPKDTNSNNLRRIKKIKMSQRIFIKGHPNDGCVASRISNGPLKEANVKPARLYNQ